MLPLLLAGIFFIFLLIGSLVFLICLLMTPTRRYALSAALWCAIWGPCAVGLMLLAGAGLIATAFITHTGDSQTLHAPKLLAVFGWAYLITGILAATLAALIHQALISRMTFALFRLYAAVVTAGIGSVFGWCLGWWMMTQVLTGYLWLLVWLVAMLIMVALFGSAAYKAARHLRGAPPRQFTWITEAEYAGP